MKPGQVMDRQVTEKGVWVRMGEKSVWVKWVSGWEMGEARPGHGQA